MWETKVPVEMHRRCAGGAGHHTPSENQMYRMPGRRKTHAPLAGRGEPPGGSR